MPCSTAAARRLRRRSASACSGSRRRSRRARGVLPRRGAPDVHEVSPLADLALVPLLTGRGYGPIEFTSVMYPPDRGRRRRLRSPSPAIRVRPIGDDESELYARVCARGMARSAELDDFMLERAVSANARPAGSVLRGARRRADRRGALGLEGGVALLAGACTVPEGRRRGAQLALLGSGCATPPRAAATSR